MKRMSANYTYSTHNQTGQERTFMRWKRFVRSVSRNMRYHHPLPRSRMKNYNFLVNQGLVTGGHSEDDNEWVATQ